MNEGEQKRFFGMKDHEIGYPDKKSTGQPFKDRFYNWVVLRYRKHNHPWMKSDERVWGGFIYGVLDYVWLVVWVWLFWWLLNSIMKHQGFQQAVLAALLMLLIRLNLLIRKITELNKKFD